MMAGCVQYVVDMTRVHLSVQLYHQSAADCILKIIAEHIPEVSCHPSLYYLDSSACISNKYRHLSLCVMLPRSRKWSSVS